MKPKYFTKWLKIRGLISPESKWTMVRGIIRPAAIKDWNTEQLFLCTNDDIKIGDEIQSVMDERTLLIDRIEINDKHTIYYDKRKMWFFDDEAFKVLGPINIYTYEVKDGKSSIPDGMEFEKGYWKAKYVRREWNLSKGDEMDLVCYEKSHLSLGLGEGKDLWYIKEIN